MKTVSRMMLSLLVVVVFVACSANPTNRWAQARSTLSVAQDTVLIAHQAGLVSDDALVKSDPLVKAARAALARAESYLPAGGTSFEHWMGIVDAILIRLEQMAAAGELNLGSTQDLNEMRAERARLEVIHGG